MIKKYENLYARFDTYTYKKGYEIVLECRNDDSSAVTILRDWNNETFYFGNPLLAQIFFNELLTRIGVI